MILLSLLTVPAGSSDGDFRAHSDTVYPIAVTATRSFADISTNALDGGRKGCQCSEASEISREAPENPCVQCVAVCLMSRGFLIAQMSIPFTNGIGADLLIYEWGDRCSGVDDAFSVYVSENGHQWVLVAEEIRNDPEDIRASIELGELNGSYLFVKIVPAVNGGFGSISGPEIVAIQAVHPAVGIGL